MTDPRLHPTPIAQGAPNIRDFTPKRTPELDPARATKVKKPSLLKALKERNADTPKAVAPKAKPPKTKKVKEPKQKRVKKTRSKAPKKAPQETPQNALAAKPPMDRRSADRRATARGQAPKQRSDGSFQSLNKYLQYSYSSVFLLVFVFGGWTFFAQIQGAVIAAGQVAVEGKPKIIQHLEGGIVSDIWVKEGDVVSKDQTVLALDATILNANLDAAETNFYENQALINRLLAEKKNQDRIIWSPTLSRMRGTPKVGSAMTGQEQLFQARRRAMRGEIDQYIQRIQQVRDEDRGLVSEIDFAESELEMVEQELTKMTDLLRRNLVSRNRVTDLERDRTRLMNSVSKLESRREGLGNSVRENQIKIDQVQRLRNEEVLTDLRLAETQADSYSEALKTVSRKNKLVEVRAPISGVVHEMTISTVGGVIAPGQEIMQIIPERESLVIHARVMPKDIDDVTIGQDTNVVFSSLKQSVVPELGGIVSYISADSIVDQLTGLPYFVVEIDIPDDQLSKLQGQSILPGMPTDIFIQTDKISVLNYLLDPLKNTLKKTMRDG